MISSSYANYFSPQLLGSLTKAQEADQRFAPPSGGWSAGNKTPRTWPSRRWRGGSPKRLRITFICVVLSTYAFTHIKLKYWAEILSDHNSQNQLCYMHQWPLGGDRKIPFYKSWAGNYRRRSSDSQGLSYISAWSWSHPCDLWGRPSVVSGHWRPSCPGCWWPRWGEPTTSPPRTYHLLGLSVQAPRIDFDICLHS